MAAYLVCRLYIILSHLIYSIQSQNFDTFDLSLKIQDLTSTTTYPIYSHSGVSALYNDKIYGFNGLYCTSSSTTSCRADNNLYTLDLSQLSIDSQTNLITFSSSPNWQQQTLIEPSTLLNSGISSTTYTQTQSGTVWIPVKYLLSYNLLTNSYNDFSSFNEIIPGTGSSQTILDSCSITHTIGTITYLFIIGGRNNVLDTVISNVYRYDITNDDWEQLSSLNSARFLHSCTVINGVIFVLGGQSVVGDVSSTMNSIEFMLASSISATWSVSNTVLYQGRNSHVSYPHPNNWIVTIGGITSSDSAAHNTELFDPLTGQVSVTGFAQYYRYVFL